MVFMKSYGIFLLLKDTYNNNHFAGVIVAHTVSCVNLNLLKLTYLSVKGKGEGKGDGPFVSVPLVPVRNRGDRNKRTVPFLKKLREIV